MFYSRFRQGSRLAGSGARGGSGVLQRRFAPGRAARYNRGMPSSGLPLRLENTVQEYPWGSRTAIPELLGLPSPAATPQAELWMGAHPRAPSRALTPEGPVPLPELIRRDPRGMLGPGAARRFGGELPFLFKVLAAAEPLSIQVHPDARQARRGVQGAARV